MAADLRRFALEKAELLSGRLKELLSSGQGYLRARFGVDLGLEPDLYPSWVLLSSAAAALLVLLVVSWAAVCGGLLSGKQRRSPGSRPSEEPVRTSAGKTVKTDEQKKRNKKKNNEKKTQSNGQPVTVSQGEVKGTEAVSKPQIKTEKVNSKVQEVLAPAQVKKNKKKAKAVEVKPVQYVSTSEGKEPDDGAWETKVSNREKRQQRRKDKSSEDSGSPRGVEIPKSHGDPPATTAPTKRNRGNQDSKHSRATGKGDTSGGAGSSSWREESSVNGPGWTDVPLKMSSQMGSMEGTKWSGMSAATHYRPQTEAQPWAQEAQAWSGIDGRMKSDIPNIPFSMLRLNTTDPISNSMDLQWTRHHVDDEWSGFNGMASEDPSSDWNAPIEHWGNYEEPPVLAKPAPLLKEQPVLNKQVQEDEKDSEDPSVGASKSKKKRKKKKTDEEAASEVQVVNTAASVSAALKPQELPVLPSKKQNTNISSTQKKSEQIVDPQKSTQKKKARKET